MLLSEVVSDCGSFVFFNSLVYVSAREADIACITQATLERIPHALLTQKGRLVFLDLNFIFDLPTCVNWADICVDLPTRVSQLFTFYVFVCRFMVFEGQNDSDWGFSFISHLGM